jgi:hypothetical protein
VTLDAEARAFVRRSPIALFASRSPRGTPFLTPLWFVERAGRLCCTTSATSVTVRNVEANGEAALLLYPPERGRDDRALRLQGDARARRGRLPLGVLAAMAGKYYAAPGALAVELAHARLWPLRLRYYAQSDPALLEFLPASAEWTRAPS